MTEQTAVDDRVEEIVADSLRVDREALTDDVSFGPEGLDADSLDVVEMAETIDLELGVRVPDEDLQELETVGDVKAYVAAELD